MKKIKKKFVERIFNALITNGVEYDTAWELVYYQPKAALELLNSILKSKKS
jgi:hypothetical protein